MQACERLKEQQRLMRAQYNGMSTSKFSSELQNNILVSKTEWMVKKCKANTLLVLSVNQVNDVNFENMSNDDAVRILREIVSKTG